MVESGPRIRSASFAKWLSEPMTVRFRKASAESTCLNPALDKKEIPEKSRPFDYALAIRLNDSRKDSMPFQSSPYICTNIITGTPVPKRMVLGQRFAGVSVYSMRRDSRLNAWYSAARTVTRIPHPPEVIHLCG